MASAGLFAVSIVYSRSEELKFIFDEEGMIIGAAPRIGISCATGYAMAVNKDVAILEVRGSHKNNFRIEDGWVEQFANTQRIPIDTWAQLTVAWIKFYGRRLRRLVRLS